MAKGLLRQGHLPWLIAYLSVITAIAAGVWHLRRVTLATLDTPQARADWNAWRQAPPNTRTDLPVRRRPPASDEPPRLVLMRDHFAVIMSAALVFGSLLFGMLVFALRGVFSRGHSSHLGGEGERAATRDVGPRAG